MWPLLLAALVSSVAPGLAADPQQQRRPPHVLLITVDTLRPDHMSGYGYERRTSPNIDRLMQRGVRFTEARTIVPLTCPALSSMFTTVGPHVHGSTRNGIRIRPGLDSFPKLLAGRGYETAAFVSNWALQDHMCGMAEHFDEWEEVLVRRRWLFSKREAEAADVTDEAVDWLRDRARKPSGNSFFLWVHYMDPHSPYVLNREYLEQIGIGATKGFFSLSNRYDTEIAHVDAHIGRLLDSVDELLEPSDTLILFTSDHGESLGDHGYWGHGRHVYENGLRIPMSVTWPGVIEEQKVDAPALIVDVAATLFGLLGLEPPAFFEGIDWSPVIRGESAAPAERITYYQAHAGTVDPKEDPTGLRRKGLLELGVVEGTRKEVLVLRKDSRRVFDVAVDPAELQSLVASDTPMSKELAAWRDEVLAWLERSESEPVPSMGEEDLERLRSLGYLD
jgi:arylsulfatase A-like enzyme